MPAKRDILRVLHGASDPEVGVNIADLRLIYKRAITSDDLVRFSELDFERHVGLPATIQQNGHQRFIGVGRYVRTDLPSHAEVAAAVSDEYQGIGIGPLLIRHLARIAHANGNCPV